jgi:hypothetical protein
MRALNYNVDAADEPPLACLGVVPCVQRRLGLAAARFDQCGMIRIDHEKVEQEQPWVAVLFDLMWVVVSAAAC